MADQTGNRPADAPTFALTAIVLVVAISAITLALTGIGLASALVAIGICRFFGRPHIAFGLLAIAAALLAFSLAQTPYPNVWTTAFPAYWATWTHGTFPAVTALIWLDPTELPFDRLTLIAVGMMAGGAFELIAHGRRNGAVAELVGIEVGVVSGVMNLESSGVEASDWRLRHEQAYHEARFLAACD